MELGTRPRRLTVDVTCNRACALIRHTSSSPVCPAMLEVGHCKPKWLPLNFGYVIHEVKDAGPPYALHDDRETEKTDMYNGFT